MTAAYIYILLRLPWLAPDITTAIVNGRQPQPLNAQTLMRTASRLPADWADQRALLRVSIKITGAVVATPVLTSALVRSYASLRTVRVVVHSTAAKK